ncbi:P-loop containing nucleoside triphosphate hydrolase [Neofusicoccum parvum]|uniref:P-loop containing nucleoside triphosphate hydrolase n=1 Tax=Neofusicoccum parvum TaxID=310453 RepID=A0ACB5SF68_9PEZI|nr:P-loop containing nucleoside triphosphate hydrolase [Neofusicoccum parvum]
MPLYAQGALTLGLGQSKDHTVQAAMRLRQLATTQSVVFFSTPEVHQSILDQRNLRPGSPLDSYDVVCWLLEQTCNGIEQLQPLYYSQGADFCRRSQAMFDNPNFLADVDQRDACLKELRQTEHQTLEQLYKPRTKAKLNNTPNTFSPQIAAFMKDLNRRRKGFQDHGNAVHGSALQEVEQEREVAQEVESVREVQKPVYFAPHKFGGLHKDIIAFAKTGRLAAGSAGYEHIFVTLRHTALGLKYRINGNMINSRLFVSKEFSRTVVLSRANDNFLRQVNWILWSTETNTAIVVVPEEAEELIPLVRKAKKPVTYLLTYATPVTRKMLHFNNLTYYSIPTTPPDWKAPDWMKIELGLLAGRLYFEFDEFSGMTKYLGLREDDAVASDDAVDVPSHADAELLDDGDVPEQTGDFIKHNGTAETTAPAGFTAKPLTFLQEWLAVRRKGQDFTHTPMGYVCQGKPLNAKHPFFAKVVEEPSMPAVLGQQRGAGAAVNGDGGVVDEEDEDDDYDGLDEEDLWYDAMEDTEMVGFEEGDESIGEDVGDGEEVEEDVVG